MKIYAITTVDNPIDPLDDPMAWMLEDWRLGYNTPSLLARLSYTSDAMSPYEQNEEMSRAIDRIIELHAGGLYKKIEREVDDETELGNILGYKPFDSDKSA